MASLKIVFSGEEIKATVKSKSINEVKLKWFLELVDKHFIVSKEVSQIKVYRGTRKIRDCFFNVESFDILWDKWINYNKTQEKCQDMIDELGLDFMCENCGTELHILDDECSHCDTATHWNTDCQVLEVREFLSDNGYEDERL